MSRKRVFVEELSELEKRNLTDGWQHGRTAPFRNRCQAILMINHGYKSEELAELFSVRKRTIYTWIRTWKKARIMGLVTQPGQGRKPKLSVDNEEHVKVVATAVKNAAEKGINMKDEIMEKLDLEEGFSNRTLRRFLQKKTMLTRDFEGLQRKNLMQDN